MKYKKQSCLKQVRKHSQKRQEMAALWTASQLLENCRVATTAGMDWILGANPLDGMRWKSENLLSSTTQTKSKNHSKNGQPRKSPKTVSPVNYAGLQGSAQWLDENSWNTATNSAKSLLGAKTDPLLEILEKSPAETPIRSSSTMEYILSPSDCAVSLSFSSTTNPNNNTTHKILKNQPCPSRHLKSPGAKVEISAQRHSVH